MFDPCPIRVPLALVATSLLLGCGAPFHPSAESSPEPSASGPPRLLLLSALDGTVEPCGCTIDLHLGGLDRIASVVAEARRRGPTAVLVVGAYLFGHQVAEHMIGQAEAKAETIAEALHTLAIDAIVPTATDLLRGEDFFTRLESTWPLGDVTANVAGGQGRMISLGAVEVGVLGLVPQGERVPRGRGDDPLPAARAETERLRLLGADVVVVLTTLPRRAVRRLARVVDGVDLWVLGRAPREEPIALPLGRSAETRRGYLIEVGDRGRHIGRVELIDVSDPGPLADPIGDLVRRRRALTLQLDMRRALLERTGSPALRTAIAELERELSGLQAPATPVLGKQMTYALVPIESSITPEAGIGSLLDRYESRLEAINQAFVAHAPPAPTDGNDYLGRNGCRLCHDEAYAVWRQTRHATAWSTIVEANKTFDADCVSCHVTGWMQPGGAGLGNLGVLKDVQCESCHGPGWLHAESAGAVEPVINPRVVNVCVGCHNQLHSPRFDPKIYRPKILGPGHGKGGAR